MKLDLEAEGSAIYILKRNSHASVHDDRRWIAVVWICVWRGRRHSTEYGKPLVTRPGDLDSLNIGTRSLCYSTQSTSTWSLGVLNVIMVVVVIAMVSGSYITACYNHLLV